jgi:PTS system mannitol-specific IIC component
MSACAAAQDSRDVLMTGHLRSRVQRFGAFLSAMIVPNIPAFLAWGVITAMFAPGGWLPTAALARLISPMLVTLLPLLIGFSGGRMVHGARGGVVGAVATMGAIVASDSPMFLGAMVLGPLGGWAIRQWDRTSAGRYPVSLHMLVANFSAGLVAALLALVALIVVAPSVRIATDRLGAAAHALTASGFLPLVAVVIEPAKVLFLNNAINHGVLAPLGAAEAHAQGQSIFFLLETNPGPGLGLLLAFWLAGGEAARQSAPGAVVVHFFGGIHEIYFPYVLMQPFTILAVIAGGIAANTLFVATGAGLVATPSPGSIVAELAMAPRGAVAPVLTGIATGALVSFFTALLLVRRVGAGETSEELTTARSRSRELKGAGVSNRQAVVFACDAGMGSSVLGAAVLQRKLKEAGIVMPVTHAAINELSAGCGIVVVHTGLADRVRRQVPDAVVFTVDDFVRDASYDALVELLRAEVKT